jgi:hypothetical protein
MNQTIFNKLLNNATDLKDEERSKIQNIIINGEVTDGLSTLESILIKSKYESKAIKSLRLYLLHLANRHAEANQVLDEMLGMNISQQLIIDNCPTEEEITSQWDETLDGISILCTTFNHARFIDIALSSFFSQVTNHPFEVVVRDDASTDGTQELLKKWKVRYPKIIKIHQLKDNTYQKGQCPLLAILQLATMPLIALCEGDDFWVDNKKIQIQADLLQKNTTWSAITHNHFELSENHGTLTPGRPIRTRGILAKNDLLNVNLVLWLHTLMIRKSLLDMPLYHGQDNILGDQIVTAMLGVAGPVYYMGDFLGSVARRNLFSIYTPLNDNEKQKKRIITKRFLAPILLSHGESSAARRLSRWCDIAEEQLYFNN